MIPLITCEIPLVGMSASRFLVSICLIWILESRLIRLKSQSRATLWVLETCVSHWRTSAFNDHFNCSFIVLKHKQQSFLTRGLDIWRKNQCLSSHRFSCETYDVCEHHYQVAPIHLQYEKHFQEQKRLDPVIPEQATHPISVQCQERWFQILLNCEKQQFVSCTSNLLEQRCDFQKRTMFLQRWISNLQDLPRSQIIDDSEKCWSDLWGCRRSRSHQGTVAPRTPGCNQHKPLWWSGRWAHTLWEARSRPGCQGPQRKVHRFVIHDIKEVESVGQVRKADRFFSSRTPWIQFLRMRWWRRSNWIGKNVHRYTMRVPNAWVALLCGSAFLQNGWAFHQGLDEEGKTGNVWLLIDSASWKSLESFIQLISFCNSWILPVSARMVSRSSINSPEIVSNVLPWIASILPSHWDFSRELHEDPSFASIIVHEEVDDFVAVVRLLECNEVHSTISFNAKICSRRVLIVRFQSFVSQFLDIGCDLCHGKLRVSPFQNDWLKTTNRTTSFLLQSDRLVFGTRQGACCRWWCCRSPSLRRTVARSRTPDWIRHKSLWRSWGGSPGLWLFRGVLPWRKYWYSKLGHTNGSSLK